LAACSPFCDLMPLQLIPYLASLYAILMISSLFSFGTFSCFAHTLI